MTDDTETEELERAACAFSVLRALGVPAAEGLAVLHRNFPRIRDLYPTPTALEDAYLEQRRPKL